LEASITDIYSDNLLDDVELSDVGYLLALTGNPDINQYAINKFSRQFGENGSFRLVSSQEMDNDNTPKEGLFSYKHDFGSLIEVTRKYPSIQEIDLEDREHFEKLIEETNTDGEIIPLFVKDPDGELHIISSRKLDVLKSIKKGYQLVYLGKPFDVEKV